MKIDSSIGSFKMELWTNIQKFSLESIGSSSTSMLDKLNVAELLTLLS